MLPGGPATSPSLLPNLGAPKNDKSSRILKLLNLVSHRSYLKAVEKLTDSRGPALTLGVAKHFSGPGSAYSPRVKVQVISLPA